MVNDKNVKIELKNVMCVPKLRVNLLSISTIEKAGYEIVCSNGQIFIKKGNDVFVIGNRCNNLYKIIFKFCNIVEPVN